MVLSGVLRWLRKKRAQRQHRRSWPWGRRRTRLSVEALEERNLLTQGTSPVSTSLPAVVNAAGHALLFDGAQSYVDTGAWSPGSAWTLEAWGNPSALPAGRH